jgi:hypothetical protein
MPQMMLTPREISQMPPHEQAKHMQSMNQHQRALVQNEINDQRIRDNRRFMRQSLEKIAYCPVAGGSGVTAAYSPGTTLVFDMPVVGSGFAKGLLVTYNLTVTPATAGGAAYAVNAAAPWNIFSEVDLLYNGPQIRTHPYIFKLLDQTKGFSRGQRNQVLAGQNDATIAQNVVGTVPVVVNTGNTWLGKIFIPFNALGEDSVPGMLPVMGVGNKPQLKLQCVSSFMGVDPLLNPVTGTGGASPSVAVSGNINVDMIYLDGQSMESPVPLTLNLAGEPTLQYFWDTPLNPLNANLIQRQHINTLLEHWYVFSILIDGGQSNQFATLANITNFELSPDSVGQQTFLNYNVANNISIYDWYDRYVRRLIGQDLDNGVFPWVMAPTRGVIDADNRNGIQTLNMRPGGYPATTHGYQVASTGGISGVTPRVETLLVSMNYDGLRIS